jgi:hypothetical protein
MSAPLQSLPPRTASSAVWWGWVAAPAWWLGQFELRYALVPWACRAGHRWAIFGLGVVAFAGAVVLALWSWRAARAPQNGETSAFLHTGGAWMAAFSAFLVFVQAVPDLLLGPCRP